MNTQLEHVFRESFYGGYRTVLLAGTGATRAADRNGLGA